MHGGSEGRCSGSEEDEYLKSLQTQRQGISVVPNLDLANPI